MLGGLYAAASGMEAQQQQIDAISNDLANVSTNGYQSEIVGFHDLLYQSGGASSGSTVATGTGAAAQVVGRSQAQGALQNTGRPLDVAIVGPGFIQVRRPDGTIGLTRNGALQLTASGQLTDDQGLPLDPPITLPAGVKPDEVSIGPDGTVTAGGQKLGQIALVTVPAPDGLIADGAGVFSATAASGAIRPATGATLEQGSLEASNVNLATDMTEMVNAQHSYDMSSKAIQYQYQLMQMANQLRA
jgi:flagellar basal-body rod protein FlgG